MQQTGSILRSPRLTESRMAGIATHIWFKHDLGMSFTDEAASRIPSALAIRDFDMTDDLFRTPRRCCRSTPQAAFNGQLVGRALPVVVCEDPVQARAVLEAQLANPVRLLPASFMEHLRVVDSNRPVDLAQSRHPLPRPPNRGRPRRPPQPRARFSPRRDCRVLAVSGIE